MPAVKQKDGTWRVKKKDGTLGKRRFSTMANALAAQRRAPGKKKAAKRKAPRKAPAKKKTTRRKAVAKKGNPNKSPKIGAAIQAFKGGHAVFAPVIEAGVRVHAGAEPIPSLKRAANIDLAQSLVVEGVNHAVDRKIAHGAALSRGSATAWAAEGFAGLRAFQAAKGTKGADTVRQVNISLSRTIRGYEPAEARMNFLNDDQRNYNLIKIGGGVVRRVSNMGPFKKIFAPAKKLLGEMGGAL